MKAEYQAFNQQFTEAVDFMASKTPEVTRWAGDRAGPWHAKAFTAAGFTQTSALADIQQMTKDAQTNGVTLAAFRKDFVNQAQSKGWLVRGELKDARYLSWRAELIYNTNLRSAYMAGRWKQLQESKDTHPLLKYMAIMDARTRPQHRAWNGITRLIDDAFWSTHYPPCGYNCRCTVVAVRLGDPGAYRDQDDRKPFKTEYRDVINPRTGEVTDRTVIGIDPGFDHNVGEAWISPELALGKKIAALPSALRGIIADKTLTPVFTQAVLQQWKTFRAERKADGVPRGKAQVIGFLDAKTLVGLGGVLPNLALDSTAIAVIDDKTNHLSGMGKAKKAPQQVWPQDWLDRLPSILQDYQAIYLQPSNGNLIVVAKNKLGGLVARVVLKPNSQTSFGKAISVISLGTTPLRNFAARKLVLIAGSAIK